MGLASALSTSLTGLNAAETTIYVIGNTLAHTVTLQTGGSIRTSDGDTIFNADGLTINVESSASNTNRLRFVTGAAVKAAYQSIYSYTDGNAVHSYHDTTAQGSVIHTNTSLIAYAGAAGTAQASLQAFGDGENKSAGLFLEATPSTTQLQTDAAEVFITAGHLQLTEISEPSAPSSNRGRLFLKDDGSGKTQLCVRFNSGNTLTLATQGVGTLPYLLWVGKFSQGGTSAPSTTTIYNSLGATLSWSRTDVGAYEATTGVTLNASKCIFVPSNTTLPNGGDVNILFYAWVNANKINIACFDPSTLEPTEAELSDMPLMLYVFP